MKPACQAKSAHISIKWHQNNDLTAESGSEQVHNRPFLADCYLNPWGQRYPAIIQLWRNAWEEFIPFLDYNVEIRKVICSTNAIESLNARYRRAVKARGHFPTEQAAMKCLYLVTRSLDPKGTGQTKWAVRWKPALNAFAITFAQRVPAAETN